MESLTIEFLDEQLAVATDHRRSDVAAPARTGGEQGDRRHSGKRRVPADRQAVRRSDGDPDASEAARAYADDDLVGGSALEQLGDHPSQPLGVAAADLLVLARNALAAVEQSGGADGGRRVERKDHGRMMVTSGATPQPLEGQTASTVSTSGT